MVTRPANRHNCSLPLFLDSTSPLPRIRAKRVYIPSNVRRPSSCKRCISRVLSSAPESSCFIPVICSLYHRLFAAGEKVLPRMSSAVVSGLSAKMSSPASMPSWITLGSPSSKPRNTRVIRCRVLVEYHLPQYLKMHHLKMGIYEGALVYLRATGHPLYLQYGPYLSCQGVLVWGLRLSM